MQPVGQRSRIWALLLYLLAWILVGTFFVTCVYFADSAQSWRREGRGVAGFLYTYALALPGGFALQVTAALLVLLLTRVTRRNGVVHWLGFGAAVGIALPWALARAGYLLEGARFAYQWQWLKTALMFPLMGAMMYEVQPAWSLLGVGAATAGLCRASGVRSNAASGGADGAEIRWQRR